MALTHPDPVRAELNTVPRTGFAGLLANWNQLTGAAVWDRRHSRTGRPARTAR
jgi:hypothetical protein